MMFLWIILGIICVFIVITLIRAAFYTEKKTEKRELEPENIDFDRYCRNLSDAIKIKTISNYDHELVDWSEFDKFHAFLEERYPLVHKAMTKTKVGDASLIYKWEGTDPSLDGIALLAHQDVVPIADGTEGDWEHEPFSGENDGEFIWGRGAMDMKNHLIAVMECMETLIAEGYQPKRTVYVCLGHNEEVVAAPDNGAKAMADYLAEHGVHLEAVLDEGGAILPANVKGIVDCNLVGVGIAEKGSVNYKISVNAKGGHSSQPPEHTALGELANVIRDIENHQFKATMPDFVSDLFKGVGKRCTYPARLLFCNLWLLKPIIIKIMTKIPPAASLIRTCTAVTMASGSPQFNVLPQKASITVNFRTMPGVTIKDVEEHIRKSVRNKKIDIEGLTSKEASKVSSTDSRAFKIIKELSESADEKNLVVPFLVMGATDSYNYENVCENIYRFAPFVADTRLLLCTHGTNERLPLSSVEGALTFFKRYVKGMTS
ncbi:MAG: M20/M25/M40 family metallo-hydrolase [Oscillospiraceae bacterium]|nr:M20/M25/M40 family metallo-hydrolase [Oscillospiraceae bacterium]